MINFLLPSKAATVQTLGHPAAGVIGWFDSSQNASGIPVNTDSALTFAAVWCAVRVISETIGTLPCVLYRRTGDDSREKAKEDWRYDLMRNQPHPQISAANFFESQTAHMVMSGNCYSRIRYAPSQTAAQLEPRTPANVQIEINGDRIAYEVTGDQKETLPAERMLHVAGIGGDGVSGWSVVKYAQQSIGTGMAGEQYAAAMHGSGATPHGVIEFPGRLDKEGREQLRREWNQIHGGASKSGNIGIMHGGMKFQPVSMSAEDAQFLQSREYSVREIARWFRLPPHMLADLADSSVRANIEQQALEFVTYSLKPWLVKWQQALNRKLLTEPERQDMYFEFMVDSLLSTDQKSRYEGYAVGRQWGFLSIDDIRKRENMNTVEGGDDYLQPTNMQVVGDDPEPEPQAMIPQPQMDDLRDDIQEARRRQIAAIRRVARVLASRLSARRTDIDGLNETIAEAERELCERMSSVKDELRQLHGDFESRLDAVVTGHYIAVKEAVQDGVGEIKQSIGEAVEQASTAKARAAEACNQLLREHLTRSWHVEQKKVLAAAKQAERNNKNFIAWLDEFYASHHEQLSGRIAAVAGIFASLSGGQPVHEAIAGRITDGHKQQLLNATDGDRGQFVQRVETLVAQWETEIPNTSFGG